MGTNCDGGNPGSRPGSRGLRSWVVAVAALTLALATGVHPAAGATTSTTLAVHHHSRSSIGWLVFLFGVIALAVILLLVRSVRMRRRH